MSVSQWLSITKCVLVSIGTCTNLYTNWFISKTFDINQSLYRVLWLDCLTTTVSTFASFLEVLWILAGFPCLPLVCLILAYLSHAGFYTNPLLTFMISYIRFMKLKYAKTNWKSNKTILKGITWTTIGMYLGLMIFSLLCVYFRLGYLSSYYACLDLPQPLAETGLTLHGILILGFLVVTIFSSIIMDLLCLWRLKYLESSTVRPLEQHQHQPQVIHQQFVNPERKIFDEMPIRSSLFNTIFLIPYIFIVIYLAQNDGDFLDQEKRDLMGIPFFVITIVRSWLVATLTFKKNDSNRQRNADQEREVKRGIEIQEALEKRKSRAKG